jgi:hypothetical protein
MKEVTDIFLMERIPFLSLLKMIRILKMRSLKQAFSLLHRARMKKGKKMQDHSLPKAKTKPSMRKGEFEDKRRSKVHIHLSS